MESSWPKRPDGSNMTFGEMTPAQQREQMRLCRERFFRRPRSPALGRE